MLSKNKINQNKLAFTLAEVLITLGIIGVVAAMTIPALMQRTNDLELKTAYKKLYSEMSQAHKNMIKDGVIPFSDYANDYRTNFPKYFATAKTCGGAAGCWHAANKWKNINNAKQNISYSDGIILNTGIMIMPLVLRTVSNNGFLIGAGGIEQSIVYVVDVNGSKPPNTMGRDIFEVEFFGDRVLPGGAPGTNSGYSSYCDPAMTDNDKERGAACSILVITNQPYPAGYKF